MIMMPNLARTLVVIYSILLIICIIKAARLQSKEKSLSRYDIGFSLATVGMLLISPVGWMYYFPILILPFFVIWNASASLKSTYGYRLSAIVVWVISSISTEFIPSSFKDMDEPFLWFTSAGYYFYALVALSMILIIMSCKITTPKTNRSLPTSTTIRSNDPHGMPPTINAGSS